MSKHGESKFKKLYILRIFSIDLVFDIFLVECFKGTINISKINIDQKYKLRMTVKTVAKLQCEMTLVEEETQNRQ